MKTKMLTCIASVVAGVCDVSVEDIQSISRRTELIEARAIFVFQANKYGLSANDIAKFINKKNTGSIYCYLVRYRYFKQSSISFRFFALQVDRKLTDNFIQTH